MLQHYLILGLDPDSPALDDDMVRRAYLKRTREYPPSTHAERFTAIAVAYEKLQSKRSRLNDARCLTPIDTEATLNALADAAALNQNRLGLAEILDALGRCDV